MREITAEGTKFLYFTKDESLSAEEITGLDLMEGYRIHYEHMRQQLAKSNDFRIIVVEWRQPKQTNKRFLTLYYLYWIDEPDLDLLDQKVVLNSFSDSDFESALKTEATTTICFECGWEGLTLRFAVSDVYQDALDLYKKKHNLALDNLLHCPNCGADLRIPIVKIFEE